MQETVGTLTLKMTQLQQRLQVLQQQYAMSEMYPQHQALLALEKLRVQGEIEQLARRLQELLPPSFVV